MTQSRMQIKPYPLGAHPEGEHVRFSFVSEKADCGILLYDRQTGRRINKIPFTAQERIGNVYCKYINDIDITAVSYQFYEEERIVPDAHARVFSGKVAYGKERTLKDLKATFSMDHFEWKGDVRPHIPYEECICYCAHVRGFTKHASSGVSGKGTFQGMMEKIPYLKEIGVTTVELQPVYEFLEIPTEEERLKSFPLGLVSEEEMDALCPKRLNYWGYKKGYYYAPKTAYATGADASAELKELVRAFHENGMEIVLQFYFPNDFERGEIADILWYWVLEYHVDGFHLMGEQIPVNMLAKDPMLSDTKLWYYDFDEETIYGRGKAPAYRNLARYNDDCLYNMRRYLKGDENLLKDVLYQMRVNPECKGHIRYLTNYAGMTLMDLVSYDRKHNEANGEDNRDGNPHNFSWNCGEEGPSRKKKIVALRKRQIKNAMTMLLLGQSTPLIFMGDEFGNSQKGNNNPYCQDNTVTWLDWKDIERGGELLAFWKLLVELRKSHPIFRMKSEMNMMDSLSCGYPDLSYHGQNAWRMQTEGYNRHAGIMLCGKYAKKENGEEDSFLYIGMNMYWEEQKLALPDLPKGMEWKCILSTDDGNGKVDSAKTVSEKTVSGIKTVTIPARCVCLFEGTLSGEKSISGENIKR